MHPCPSSNPARRAALIVVVAGVVAAAPGPGSASSVTSASCAPVVNPATVASGHDPGLAPFGPLSSHPVVDIAVSAGDVVGAERIPGATVVSSFLGGEQYALDLVEDGGSVRWRRCVAAPWLMSLVAGSGDGEASVLLYRAGATVGRGSLRVLDVATGADFPVPGDIPEGMGPAVWSARYALLESDAPNAATQSLLLVDLVTLATTQVPVPGQVAKGSVQFPTYSITDDGILGFSGEDDVTATLAIFSDGTWSTDRSAIDAAMPVTVGVDDYETMAIVARSASGAVLWTAPGVTDPAREGFHDVTVGDVTLIGGCTELRSDGICAGESLLALETATGEVRWSLPEYRAVYASGNGYALINDQSVPASSDSAPPEADIVLIDLATGEPVDGQRWSGDSFHVGCCADMSFTSRRGGVVVTSDGTSVQVYLPVGFESLPTAHVTLG